MMSETGMDPSRIAFLGQIPHDQLIRLFQISSAHVYLTYPFVLSWSVLEAMACGTPVIASDTGPCRDIIRHGKNGLMCGFWDEDQLAATMAEALAHPERLREIRKFSRLTITRNFALQQCLERQTGLIERMAKR